MEYRITPLNVLFLLCFCVYAFFKLMPHEPGETDGTGIYLLLAILMLLADLLLQYLVKNYKRVLMIELAALPVIIIIALAV